MMKKISGNLRKMTTRLNRPVDYMLTLSDAEIPLNAYMGQPLQLRYTGRIFCVQCGRKTSKSFQQGHCFPCMQRLAECDFCIIHPEKCHVERGTCPENDWAHAQCRQAHIVYLANSSGLKVGITRQSQAPTRWIDQGAGQALPIFQTANRYQSGLLEVCLKQFVSDRTDWRKLLKSVAPPLDLIAERDRLCAQAASPLAVICAQDPDDIQRLPDAEAIELHYPMQQYPQKIASLSFDKAEYVTGQLHGIKGQYLLLDTGVINIRKYSGYEIEFIL